MSLILHGSTKIDRYTCNITAGVTFSEAQKLHLPVSSVTLQAGNFRGEVILLMCNFTSV